MDNLLPKIKKSVSSFISDEQGRVSNQSLVTIGAFPGFLIKARTTL